jgi:hypothetical protein
VKHAKNKRWQVSVNYDTGTVTYNRSPKIYFFGCPRSIKKEICIVIVLELTD